MAEVPVGVFPELGFQWDVAESEEYFDEVETSEKGSPQRTNVGDDIPLRRFKASTTLILGDEAAALRAFWRLTKGRTESFYFYPPDSWQETAVKVGTSDGVATTFVMPYKESTVTAAYDNDTGHPIAFAVTPGAGPNGEDELVIGAPLTAGHAVLVDIDGRARILGWFPQKSLGWGYIEAGEQPRVCVIEIWEIPAS